MKLGKDKLEELLGPLSLDRRGQNLTGKCPQCGHTEFGISLLDNHRFGCYRKKRCGFSGNIYTLLRFLGKYEEWVEEGGVYSVKESTSVEKKIVDTQGLHEIEKLPSISLPVGYKRIHNSKYLESRGFNDEEFKRYEVGESYLEKFNECSIFPVREDGEIKAYVGRFKWTKEEVEEAKQRGVKRWRYKNSNSDFSQVLYGLDELTEETSIIIIAEGIFDKINIDRQFDLFYQDNIKCLATFKCKISDRQLLNIKRKAPNCEAIYLFYDNDVLRDIISTARFLENHYEEVLIAYDENIQHDPGDMTYEELESFIGRMWTSNSLSLKKISKKSLA